MATQRAHLCNVACAAAAVALLVAVVDAIGDHIVGALLGKVTCAAALVAGTPGASATATNTAPTTHGARGSDVSHLAALVARSGIPTATACGLWALCSHVTCLAALEASSVTTVAIAIAHHAVVHAVVHGTVAREVARSAALVATVAPVSTQPPAPGTEAELHHRRALRGSCRCSPGYRAHACEVANSAADIARRPPVGAVAGEVAMEATGVALPAPPPPAAVGGDVAGLATLVARAHVSPSTAVTSQGALAGHVTWPATVVALPPATAGRHATTHTGVWTLACHMAGHAAIVTRPAAAAGAVAGEMALLAAVVALAATGGAPGRGVGAVTGDMAGLVAVVARAVGAPHAAFGGVRALAGKVAEHTAVVAAVACAGCLRPACGGVSALRCAVACKRG
jgi:hypothetical protein